MLRNNMEEKTYVMTVVLTVKLDVRHEPGQLVALLDNATNSIKESCTFGQGYSGENGAFTMDVIRTDVSVK